MSDATRPVRAVDGPPPGAPAPGGDGDGLPPGAVPPPPPGGDGPDWQRILIGGLIALIVLLVLVLALVRAGGDDDGDDVATDRSTTTTEDVTTTTSTSTTTSSTSSTTTAPPPPTTTATTAPTTTTASSTPTTTGPPPTVAPARCTGKTGPQDPAPVARTFYDAWTLDDRACAQQIASEEALEDLFVFDGAGADWSFESCAEDEDLPQTNCYFRYEGGSATFALRYGNGNGWRVESVTFTAD